jgi:type IV pilus assembly protein PilW
MLLIWQLQSRTNTPGDSRGFSLLEVMVALVVLCVGLLGILKLEAAAISSTTVAAKRSLAALEAASLAASMHVNRGFWATATNASVTVQGAAAVAATASPAALQTSLGTAPNCTSTTVPCGVTDMAAYDLNQWALALQPLLPNYTAAITCNNAPVVTCTVNIVWNENAAVAINAQEAAQQALNPNATFESPNYTLIVEPLTRIALSRLRGFTLIELMIAITVAIFLVGGLLWMVQSTRNTFAAQNQLAQLQDNERLVLTFMTEVIEAAGYFPNPAVNTSTAVMPVALPTFATAGQAVSGQGAFTAAAPGDTVSIRYGAGPNDDIFNCRGTKNAVAPYDTFVNTFSVSPAGVLTCTFSSGALPLPGVPVPLVNGVKTMVILYGVKKNPADTLSCADTYLDATQMAATDWSNVCTVKVTVSFINPLDPNKPTIDITRVIAVMSTAGVNS